MKNSRTTANARRAISTTASLGIVLCLTAPSHAGTPTCERRFLPQQIITTGALQAVAVLAADLDGDGDSDVLSASLWDDKIEWYENVDGIGTFGPPRVISLSARGVSAIVADDLDGDTDMDVLVALYEEDSIVWYENTDGLGTFGPKRLIRAGVTDAAAVRASDLDGDGDADVVAASRRDDTIEWYENLDGLGNFGAPRVVAPDAQRPEAIFTTDIDGDGDFDVIAGTTLDQKIAWYENTNGLGSFGPARVITTNASSPDSLFATDVDGDGDVDLIAATGSSSSRRIVWFENTDGLGAFGAAQLITNAADGASSVFAADLDGDGDTDTLSASTRDNKIAWYENTDGLGSFGPQQVITTQAMNAQSVVADDIDGDGDPDVLSASDRDSKIAWYVNEADCNGNGINDGCDLEAGTSADCNANSRPDECEVDCNGNGVPDSCENDCNCNNIDDSVEIDQGSVDDCNANLIPDACDLAAGSADCNLDGIPDECQNDCNCNNIDDAVDISTGASDDCNADGIPDECVGPALAVAITPDTSRYLTISPIVAPGVRSAIRITFVKNYSFSEVEGQSLWVGRPRAFPEEDTSKPNNTFVGARLSCTPHYHDWSTIDVLDIFGAEIVPRSIYTVQLIDERCSESLETSYSSPLLARTGRWGDVWYDFADPTYPWPNFNDIAGSVQKFLAVGSKCNGGLDWGRSCADDSECAGAGTCFYGGNPGAACVDDADCLPDEYGRGGTCIACVFAAPLKSWAQLQPNVVLPDRAVDFRDIAAVVNAFLGTSYVNSIDNAESCTCPSSVTCGATACADDRVCAPGFCIDGFCTDKCGRCTP